MWDRWHFTPRPVLSEIGLITLWWKNPIFSPTANYGSLKSAQKIQSNGTVIIAYSWFYDELQASEFLTFPFSKLKLKFSIWNGGTLKLQFRFHYQIAICYSEKYRCSTKNEFQFPFHIWNFSLSNWNMKWKVSWNWAIIQTLTFVNWWAGRIVRTYWWYQIWDQKSSSKDLRARKRTPYK